MNKMRGNEEWKGEGKKERKKERKEGRKKERIKSSLRYLFPFKLILFFIKKSNKFVHTV